MTADGARVRATDRSRLPRWWQEYRGTIVALLLTGWVTIATIAVFFLGITPSEPPCISGALGSEPMDPQAREALCTQLRGATRVEWQASLTTLQRVTQEPWVWVIWYVIPLLLIGAVILLADRLLSVRIGDAPAT